MLEIPRTCPLSNSDDRRNKFWNSLTWSSERRFTKNKKNNKRKDDVKPFNFGQFSWSKMLSFEYYKNVDV